MLWPARRVACRPSDRDFAPGLHAHSLPGWQCTGTAGPKCPPSGTRGSAGNGVSSRSHRRYNSSVLDAGSTAAFCSAAYVFAPASRSSLATSLFPTCRTLHVMVDSACRTRKSRHAAHLIVGCQRKGLENRTTITAERMQESEPSCLYLRQ
jgi:hypothetical protein